jgi:hypothetical protein
MRERAPVAALLALACRAAATASPWQLVWADEFDGAVVNTSLWNVASNVYEGPPSTSNQIELYTAANVFLDGRGHLVLTTQQQDVEVDGLRFNVTSGRVDSSFKGNVSWAAAGRVEVAARLQNDAAYGLHTAHWLVGYGCWPTTAEVDIMECQSPHNAYADAAGGDFQVATSNYHWGTSCGNETHHTTGTSAWPHAPGMVGNYSTDFTIFAVEWNATAMSMFVNDTKVNTLYAGMPGWSGPFQLPDYDMYVIISQAYMKHRPLGDPPAWVWREGVRQVLDYVRVYRAAAA